MSTELPRDPGIRRPTWIDRVQPLRFVELFDKYRRRMTHKETGLPFDPTARDEPLSIEKLAFSSGAALRLALKLFAPGCLLLFLVSFAWDFQNGLIRACAVAGLIGFGTNWIAIKMLFWPKESRPIFGHGLIPSQREQLIHKVADEVLTKLINEELILEKIEEVKIVPRFSKALIEKLRAVVREEEFKADLKRMVLTYAGELASNPDFRHKLGERAEKSLVELGGSSLRTWVVKKLKDVWREPLIEVINRELETLDATLDGGLAEVDGVLARLPSTMERHQEAIDRVLTTMLLGMVREVDLREIILEQLEAVTSDELEKAFRAFSDDKLAYITLLGGIFGVVGGPVMIWPVQASLVLAAMVAAGTALDVAIVRLRRSPAPATAAQSPQGTDPPAPPGGAPPPAA